MIVGGLVLEMITHINTHTSPLSAGKINAVPAFRKFYKAAEALSLGKIRPECMKPLSNRPRKSLCLTGAHSGQSEKGEVGLQSSRGKRLGGSDGKGKETLRGEAVPLRDLEIREDRALVDPDYKPQSL